MNYYEHHIGDYAAATAHLSMVEDAAYSRMLRIYYRDEKPLPVEVKQVQRAVGARTREERQAVADMLGEFFELQSDGWHSKRADEEIARYLEKQEKARASANARWSRQKRRTGGSDDGENAESRDEPSDLTPGSDANALRTHSERIQNASGAHIGRNAHQTPDSRQEHGDHTSSLPEDSRGGSGGEAISAVDALCAVMRGFRYGGQPIMGTRLNRADPRLLAAVAAGATDDMFEATAREAAGSDPPKSVGWVYQAVLGRIGDARNAIEGGKSNANSGGNNGASRASATDRVAANIQRAREADAAGEGFDNHFGAIDGEAERIPR